MARIPVHQSILEHPVTIASLGCRTHSKGVETVKHCQQQTETLQRKPPATMLRGRHRLCVKGGKYAHVGIASILRITA